MAQRLILLLSALFLFSCASSKRMMSISPFAEDPNLEKPDYDRTNLFPFFYQSDGKSSVLWPLMDWDKDGFAFRPIYNRQDSEYSILFPLSAWNPENKDGWLLTSYWNKRNFGAFPLFHYSDDFSYLLLGWKDYDAHGVFPLYGVDDDYKRFLNIAVDDSGYFIFPLAFHEYDDYFLIPGLFHWNKSQSTESYDFLMHLASAEYVKDDLRSSYMFPFWYQYDDGTTNTFASLLAYQKKGQGQEDFHIFPLWYSGESNDSNWKTLLPLFHSRSTPEKDLFITPLFGTGSSKTGDFSLTSFLGPLYFDSKSKDEETFITFPFYISHKDKNSSSKNIGLLYFDKTTKNSSTKTLFPLYWHESNTEKISSETYGAVGLYHQKSEKDESAFRLWPFYSYSQKSSLNNFFYGNNFLILSDYQKNGKTGEFNLLNGLLLSTTCSPTHSAVSNILFNVSNKKFDVDKANFSYNRYSDPVIHSKERRVLLYTYEKNELLYLPEDTLAEHEHNILNSFSNPWDHKNKNDSRIYIVDPKSKASQNKHNSDCKVCKSAQKLLASKGYVSLPDYESIKKSLKLFNEANIKEGVGSKHHFPLLYEAKFMPEESEWDILWFLADYKSNKESTNFSILRFLYNYESDGENAAHDIFPFIKADSGERSGFSFLGADSIGYLFNWKHTKEDGNQGHFLFIPWG
ncbi:MAG: hypothetical protein NE330_11365 [Lentisphaeraceae bacterium]|nr:hypothetical protein [Lentisphaeraceae bacterium]